MIPGRINPGLQYMQLWHAPMIAFGLLLASVVQAIDADEDIARVLSEKEPPAGVVFEINEGREDALKDVLPFVQGYIKQLRAQWPGIELAIVSHGLEEMGLTQQAAKDLPQVHAVVQRLLSEDKVQLHVCELAAGMNDVGAEDFPDYVNVSAYGPGQLQDYESLGYIKIRVNIP